MGNKITFEVFKEIAPLKDVWNGFDVAAHNMIACGEMPRINYTFYQTYRWNEFVEHYFVGTSAVRFGLKHIEYILMKADGEPFAIVPLMVYAGKVEFTSWRTSGVNNAVAPWQGDDKMLLFEALVDFICENYRGKKARFFDMPVRSPYARALSTLSGVRYGERGSYHIPLSDFEDFDAYYEALNKKLRHNIKTRSNHFTHGDLSWELKVFSRGNAPSADYWKEIWRLFFMRKNVWRKREINFLRKFVCGWEVHKECSGGLKMESFKCLDETLLFVFEINGRPAAFAFLYLYDGYILVPKLAIDTNQRAHAPGILMLKEIMKWCYERRVKDFDLCRGEEPYKEQMGGVCEPVCRVNVKL